MNWVHTLLSSVSYGSLQSTETVYKMHVIIGGCHWRVLIDDQHVTTALFRRCLSLSLSPTNMSYIAYARLRQMCTFGGARSSSANSSAFTVIEFLCTLLSSSHDSSSVLFSALLHTFTSSVRVTVMICSVYVFSTCVAQRSEVDVFSSVHVFVSFCVCQHGNCRTTKHRMMKLGGCR